jgi:chromosome segregation ATPase
MDFILYKNATFADKIVDDFLLCDYFEEGVDSYNGIYVSSDDEPQKQEVYYTDSLQETPKEKEKDADSITYHPELEDAEQELEDAEQELEDEEQKLEDEEQELEDAEQELEEEDDEEEDDEIELHLEELKKLIMQIEDKIYLVETKNTNMISNNFFIDKEKYSANLHEISIFKKKKKEYEKSIEFIYKLVITKNRLV